MAEYVETAIRDGARTVTDGRSALVPGHPDGYYFGATILDHAAPNMRVAKEEVFGPVASVIATGTLDDAIESINSGTNFGNMACIYTSSGRSAREFRTRTNAGNIGINIGVAAPVAHFPFGGRRDSFYGILHPQIDTIEFFTDKKITISRW